MSTTTSTFFPRAFSLGSQLILGLILLFGLVSCGGGGGGGGSSAPTGGNGLYKNGTGTLGGVPVTDIIGFVHSNRIIIFSVAAHTLIDGTIDSITDSDYTATVNVYKDGVVEPASVGIVGMVVNGSSISGTLGGINNSAGDFSLTFDLLYNRGASSARIDTSSTPPFAGLVFNKIVDAETNSFNSDTPPFYSLSVKIPILQTCTGDGEYLIPNNNINIYLLTHTVTQSSGACTMSESPVYTGILAIVDGAGVDRTLFYAINNGADSEFAVLTR